MSVDTARGALKGAYNAPACATSDAEKMMRETRLKGIREIDPQWIDKAAQRQLELTKPPGSLGRLEEIANRCVAIRETLRIDGTEASDCSFRRKSRRLRGGRQRLSASRDCTDGGELSQRGRGN